MIDMKTYNKFGGISVMSQQMVTTPVTELNSDVVQKDGWNESHFSI